MNIKSCDIARYINEAYDGVERSRLGKIVEQVPVSVQFPDGRKINTLPMNTFMSVLNNIIPKDIIGEIEHKDE